MSFSCDVHRRCALGFGEDAIPRARFVDGARQVTCPNPALHDIQQEVDLHTLLQQVLTLGTSADTPDERAIRSRVAVAELRLWNRTHLELEWVDLSRRATERVEEDFQGEWRGTTPQPHENTPCASCDRHIGDYERFAFSGWIVHSRCAVENAEGAASKGDDQFGVAIRGGTGPPRRRTFLLAEIVPRIHLRYDRSTDRGTHQQRKLEILWR